MRPASSFFSGTLLLIVLSFSACAPKPETAAVEVSCDDFARVYDPALAQARVVKQLVVPVGTPISVTLCTNPGTGFQWEAAKIDDSSIVQQVDHQIEAAGSGVPGAPVRETWSFKTAKAGTSTVSLDYSRPWAGGEKATWHVALTVTTR